MNTSENINEIAKALSSAQGEMAGATKGSKNPFFRSKYSDFASVVEAINKPFKNNGLCFVQAAEFKNGKISVTTRIMHASGQWVESVTELPPVKNDPQAYGSAITYAKRYGLQALAGVPSVDDDGQAAVENTQDEKEQKEQLILSAVNRNKNSIEAIQQAIADNDLSSVYEYWIEIPERDRFDLWVAPSKYRNAPFSTREREAIKQASNEHSKHV